MLQTLKYFEEKNPIKKVTDERMNRLNHYINMEVGLRVLDLLQEEDI